MCGRYKLQHLDQVGRDFPADFAALSAAVRRPRFNVAPGQLVLGLREHNGGRTLEQLRWGVAASWSDGPRQIINARSEKLASSRFWKPMLEQGRRALPADGFYEWRASAVRGEPKQPYLFSRDDHSGFWLAAVATAAHDDDEASSACAVITVTPNELVADVHDRMPAMLDAAGLGQWLTGDAGEALAALRPFPSTAMTARPVDRRIGNAAAEGESLITPAGLF